MSDKHSAPHLRIAGITIATSSVFGLIALACAGLLAFGLYLQHVVGLNPCPMCIVQRYAMIGLLLLGLAGWWVRRAAVAIALALVTVLLAGFGAFVAARQSWLQWYPPDVVSCCRYFYGMIENFPIGRAIPMIFKGSGDCTAIDWTFLGGTIANWSFVWFVGFALTGLLMAVQAWRQR